MILGGFVPADIPASARPFFLEVKRGASVYFTGTYVGNGQVLAVALPYTPTVIHVVKASGTGNPVLTKFVGVPGCLDVAMGDWLVDGVDIGVSPAGAAELRVTSNAVNMVGQQYLWWGWF